MSDSGDKAAEDSVEERPSRKFELPEGQTFPPWDEWGPCGSPGVAEVPGKDGYPTQVFHDYRYEPNQSSSSTTDEVDSKDDRH
jgi:hypothetical protein